VYTATFPEVVYVLDAFVKKSKSGSKTAQADKDRVRDRFKAAKRDYDEHHRKREK
jgi:phage-related protein